jgi:hypothetical protein
VYWLDEQITVTAYCVTVGLSNCFRIGDDRQHHYPD